MSNARSEKRKRMRMLAHIQKTRGKYHKAKEDLEIARLDRNSDRYSLGKPRTKASIDKGVAAATAHLLTCKEALEELGIEPE